MSFRIRGLAPAAFQHLHAMDDAVLHAAGARRVWIDAPHVAPCRISLDDAAPGEAVILLNYQHQSADTPYRQQGPIYVRDAATPFDAVGETPPALARRTLSLRAFDATHMMIEADLVEGAQAPALVERFFSNDAVAYIHAHYARRGCFAAAITRA